MKVSGVRVMADLLDPSTGSSLRTKENSVAGLLNLARCGGERVGREVKEMGMVVVDGIAEVADNGSSKGKSKAVALLKIIDDGNGSNMLANFLRDSRFDSLNRSN